ncbi:MAG: malto-oligosyltrehalose trehalohydrolase [Deltaproteobacteria bacterium]|nr:malto-oligosyltrehalose trehalohydrolase [Deltaproteobacteria bacterium]
MKIGARYLDGETEFTVWAPLRERVTVEYSAPGKRVPRQLDLEREGSGYWRALVEGAGPGTLYSFILDGKERRPDPASRSQPKGVNGPSEVVDHAYQWRDSSWKGITPAGMVIYEIHTGSFTPEGTFEAMIPRLGELSALGVNAIELMPVAQFPGTRNWGYDGVFPFAAQDSYGGPGGLKRLVDECHMAGIAIILDVVYNHLGPEGNCLHSFGPYFTDRYKTPWGQAVNFDGPFSDEVRNFFIENAMHWFEDCHVDALRLDAVHAIYDFSATTFLVALGRRVRAFSKEAGRPFYIFAESDRNDPSLVRDERLGGAGLDGLWCDDFHHSLHALVTGERDGYYEDFGEIGQLERAFKEGFVYSGQYSKYRKKSFGAPLTDVEPSRLVVFSENHDQAGNRMLGERLSSLVSFEALKLVAGAVILSPFIPLLFMGEEYGEDAPFLYFTSHAGRELAEAAARGRAEEFRAFQWKGAPPDPNSEDTFLKTRLDWKKGETGRGRMLREFYRALIEIRKTAPALAGASWDSVEAASEKTLLYLHRRSNDAKALAVFNFGKEASTASIPPVSGRWLRAIASSDPLWGGTSEGLMTPPWIDGPGALMLSPESFVLYIKEG